jgi:signal transduction histidine kinase
MGLSPFTIIWITALIIFVLESAVMLIAGFLRVYFVSFEVLLVASLSALFIAPALFLFVIRPRLRQFAEERKKQQVCVNDLIQAEKMQEVGRLASGVAHEVKNPLAVIMQGVEYLKEKLKSQDPNVAAVLKYISDAVVRADKVVVGLLDFASLSKFDMQPQDVSAVLNSALALMRNDFLRRRIEVEKIAGEDLPLVRLDKNRMEQVFVNILLNAAQAMPNGGRLLIQISAQGAGEESKIIKVRFLDTGAGIPSEVLSNLSRPFFTTKRQQGGSGLGLAVCRHIMQMHGGDFEIENRQDSTTGAKVTLTLKAC